MSPHSILSFPNVWEEKAIQAVKNRAKKVRGDYWDGEYVAGEYVENDCTFTTQEENNIKKQVAWRSSQCTDIGVVVLCV